MNKPIYIAILLLVTLWYAIGQEPDVIVSDVTVEDETVLPPEEETAALDTTSDTTGANLLVAKITFKELKYTKEKFLLSKISLQPGSVWNDESRAKLEKDLLGLVKIIEEVKGVDEQHEENRVTLTVDVVEKLPFLPLVFFTYKNSTGLVPKVLFRFYNLGGYGKYLNFKFQYEPRNNIFLTSRYKDDSFFNNDNLTFQTTLEISTSAPNYYTVAQPQYIGVLGQGDSTKTVPWNDELNFEVVLDSYVQYTVPEINIKLKPFFYIKYKKIWAAFDDSIHSPKDIIEPKVGINLSFPTKSIVKIDPYFQVAYKMHLDNSTDRYIKRGDADTRGFAEQTITPNAGISFPITIGAIDANLTPGFQVTNENIISQFTDQATGTTLGYYDNGNFKNKVLLELSLQFSKTASVGKTDHELDFKSRFEVGIIDFTTYPKMEFTNIRTVLNPNQFKVYNDFKYKFKLTFFKGHVFDMKYYLFYYYNDELNHSGYDMNEYPGSIKGWAGLIANYAYIIPLLEFTTPSWFNKSIDRPLKWKMLLELYLDGGLSQGYEGNENLSFNKWGFHLNPALGIGTAIKFDPIFIPAYIKVDFGIDVWRILKTKAFAGSIIFSFTIEDN